MQQVGLVKDSPEHDRGVRTVGANMVFQIICQMLLLDVY